MQTLAQNGNGVAAYIDTLSEAQKTLVQEATSSLFPIAKESRSRSSSTRPGSPNTA